MSKGVIIIEFDAPDDQFHLAEELRHAVENLRRVQENDGFPPGATVHIALYESAAAVLDEFHRREG